MDTGADLLADSELQPTQSVPLLLPELAEASLAFSAFEALLDTGFGGDFVEVESDGKRFRPSINKNTVAVAAILL